MIKIKSSKNADTRSAEKPVTKDELMASSYQHIKDVNEAIKWMRNELLARAMKHDHTKIDAIDQFHKDFKETQDSKGEKNFSDSEWYKMHIATERHHLDKNCPADVNLFDIMERIADIITACMARKGEFYEDNLPTEILERAYINTIMLLKNQIQVENDQNQKKN